MTWIKRNLIFVIGSAVAVILLVGAGYYTYTRWTLNAEWRDKVEAQYNELRTLNNQPIHPGNDKIDNIAAARGQTATLTNFMVRVLNQFDPVPPIPGTNNLTSMTFAAALRGTIDQLKRQAESASVELPEKYAFSFQAQSTMLTFQNLEPLAVQLGEVKKICDIVIASKVNSLDGIRRQRMTTDDMSLQASTSDYLDLPATTNENSIIMPYEVRFRCFSPELADVLAGFANSPHGLIVKSIEVVHAPPGAGTDETGIMAVQPVYQAPPTQPNYPPRQFRPPPPTLRQRLGEEERMTYGTPVRQPVQRMAPVVVPPAGSTLQTFINEQQLQVTIIVNVIRFLPKP